MVSENGIVITPKEMYDALQEVSKSLQRIEGRLDKLESKIELAHQADERSRQALELAKDAYDLAKRLEKKHEWTWKTTISALITGVIGVLFYFVQGG
jgi:molecular chaperone GrpE (heat shock protein)